jgi:hypothetical protein
VTKKIRTLGPSERTALDKASRLAIEQRFSQLKRHLSRHRWIGRNNKYRRNILDVLKDDADPKTTSTINETELGQYIAASAPLHCADGWSFVGRALTCHARGDASTALHLGYYAELRAAVSMLAVEGVGIFDQPSIAVNSTGNCHLIKGYGTHLIAWLALEHWADTQPAAELLVDVLKIQGVSCRTWLESFQKSSVINRRGIASKWLKTWGLDLRRFVGDRAARNEASYRPSRMSPANHLEVPEGATFLCELWKLHEPSDNSRFDILDKYLLRRILEETFRVVRGRLPKSDPSNFQSDIEAMVAEIQPAGQTAEAWTQFFTRSTEPRDPALITMAMGGGKQEDRTSHMQVISRAVVLLRLATGACSHLLESAKFGKTELQFWWQSLGEDLALWNDLTKPDNITDLWADVATAITQITAWTQSNKASANYASWQAECASEISVLGGCERIGLWGLGL